MGIQKNTKVIDLNSRRKKEYTIIVLNRSTGLLLGFLSIETKGERYRFTNQAELLLRLTELDAKKIKQRMDQEADFSISIVNEAEDTQKVFSNAFLVFEIAQIRFQ